MAALKILALSKRQYLGRDLIDDRYGRFRELPLELARLGHRVEGVWLSYRPRPEGRFLDAEGDASVGWTSVGVARLADPGAKGYRATVARVAQTLRPDLVWACSDVPHAVFGRRVAQRLRAPLVVDLYDNFESYSSARIPGFIAGLHWALRGAAGIGCVSAPLLRHVGAQRGVDARLEVIENAIPPGLFGPRDRARARERFGLPEDAFLAGIAGSLSPTRGVDVLFEAFESLHARDPRARLVLAGPLDHGQRLPERDYIRYQGLLPPEDVPWLLGARDVSVICNRDTAFGRFCFPQKLYESLACGVPVAVARIGAMAELLEGHRWALYEPDDAASLARTLEGLREHPRLPGIAVPNWGTIAGKLEGLFRSALEVFPAHR
jgi:glycosyltransferase involved in cell wall biosynthesis